MSTFLNPLDIFFFNFRMENEFVNLSTLFLDIYFTLVFNGNWRSYQRLETRLSISYKSTEARPKKKVQRSHQASSKYFATNLFKTSRLHCLRLENSCKAFHEKLSKMFTIAFYLLPFYTNFKIVKTIWIVVSS